MRDYKIVGIVLVRNEDLFIERVLTNILSFCDEIIVADNRSVDHTGEIVKNMQLREDKIHYNLIDSPAESHELISSYAGKKVWIFAVDGDEIYDPAGLEHLKKKILTRAFAGYWMILGNVLNCIEYTSGQTGARGYLAPPCRSMTKLYNFNVIEDWLGPCPERLHGGEVRFKEGFDNSMRLELYKNIVWENAEFRCLHLCFMRRSSIESTQEGIVIRRNISDRSAESLFHKVFRRCFEFIGMRKASSDWKMEKYMRGEIFDKNVEAFFR